jgi:hypothetical protein
MAVKVITQTLPLLLFLVTTTIYFIIKLYSSESTNTIYFCIYILFVILSQMFVNIAITGVGASGGWYLHILFPWMALAFGMAVYQIYIVKNMKRLFMVLVIYSVLFHAVALWSLMTLYTGCSVKADDKMFLFPNHLFCIDQMSLIVDRLNLLGYGSFGLTMFIFGAIIYGFILVRTFNGINFKSKYKEINK